jgi:hypothetical protein
VEAEFSRPRLRLGSVVTVVRGFVLDRGDVFDGGVKPGFVEPVDPAEGRELEVVDASPGSLESCALGLVEPDQAFGLGIVVAIPDRANAGKDPGVEEPFAVADRGVLTSRIAVKPTSA